eukprot:scaffold9114_cov118-Isochrysis_galbana.AAC.24
MKMEKTADATSSYASDSSASAASQPHSQAFSLSTPSRQSGMVQPVVQEMLATVHAAGSSLLGLFSSCTTFDSTWAFASPCPELLGLATEDAPPAAPATRAPLAGAPAGAASSSRGPRLRPPPARVPLARRRQPSLARYRLSCV